MIILSNQIKCNKCGDSVYSRHRHDFKYCSCSSVAVDGGQDYLKRSGNRQDYEDLSIVWDEEDVSALVKVLEDTKETKTNFGQLCALSIEMRDRNLLKKGD